MKKRYNDIFSNSNGAMVEEDTPNSERYYLVPSYLADAQGDGQQEDNIDKLAKELVQTRHHIGTTVQAIKLGIEHNNATGILEDQLTDYLEEQDVILTKLYFQWVVNN